MKTKAKYLAVYTAVFSVMALAVFLSFIINGKSFIWTGQEHDGLYQHYTALVYFCRWVRTALHTVFVSHSLDIPLWDFSIGYGSDILTTLHYYVIGDPIALLAVLAPEKSLETVYNVLVLLRMYLAGLSFSYFCYHKGKSGGAVLAGAMSYVFCGYCLFAAVRHPYFVNPMIYFPLLAVGADRVLQKKNPLLFVGMTFIAAISNFYFYYMIVIAAVFYVAVSLLTEKTKVKELFGWFAKFAALGILATVMAAVILVPVGLLLFGGNRSSVQLMHPAFYHYSYYQRLAASFLTTGGAGYWSVLGFTAPALLCVFALFGKQGHRKLKISFVILTALFLLPSAGSILNGFSYVTNRWCWLYSALTAYIMTEMWDGLGELNLRQRRLAAVGASVYFILMLCVRYGTEKSTFAGCCIMFAALMLMLFAKNIKENLALGFEPLYAGMFALVMINISLNANYQYSEREGGYIYQFLDAGTAYESVTENPASAQKNLVNDKNFYRYEQADNSEKNTGVLTGNCGTDYFWSLENGNITKFLREMGLNSWQLQNFSGTDKRTFLSALSSTKYFVSPVNYADEVSGEEKTQIVPFGYSEIGRINADEKKTRELEKQYAEELGVKKLTDEQRAVLSDYIKRYAVYGNANALPLGYTCESYITREMYDGMTPSQRQEAVLQSVLVEDKNDVSRIAKIGDPGFEQKNLPYEAEFSDGVELLEDGSFYVCKENAYIDLKFSAVSGCELYLQAVGMQAQAVSLWEQYHDGEPLQTPETIYNAMPKMQRRILERKMKNTYAWQDCLFDLTVSSGGIQNILSYSTPFYQWTTGQDDFLVNLGYSKDFRNSICISFPKAGIYSFDRLEVVEQPMDGYAEHISALTQDMLTDEDIGTNSISGSISLEKSKILCLSVPYDKGWTAYIDGREVPIIQANTMYMALPLTAGEHSIRLEYKTYGLAIGAAISGIGFVLFAVLAVLTVKKKKQ